MLITFCGHSEIFGKYEVLEEWLTTTIEDLIVHNNAKIFYLGGYGGFDILVARVLNKLKLTYPKIEIALVLAYLNQDHNPELYDYTIYPDLENTPKRFAILKRNEFMVNEADIIIAFVDHSWGGATITFEYAQKKNKRIINFGDYQVV